MRTSSKPSAMARRSRSAPKPRKIAGRRTATIISFYCTSVFRRTGAGRPAYYLSLEYGQNPAILHLTSTHVMKKPLILATLALAWCMTPSAHAGTKEQLIQLQTTVQILQDNMAKMQQSFDERMGVMKDLVTQQTDNINRMGTSVQSLQKTLSQQNTDSATKVDQLSGQVQALHDSVDELKARLARTTKQLDDIQAALQNINQPPAGGQTPATATPAAQAPPAETLYNSALGDF